METISFTNVLSGPTTNTQTGNLTVTGYILGKLILNGSLTEVNTGDWGSENKIRITSPSARTIELSPFTMTSYTGTISLTGYQSFYFVGDAVNTNAWTFAFRNSYDDGSDGLEDAQWDTISFDYTDELPAPPAATDLGNLVDTTTDYTMGDMGGTQTGGAVKWYKFTTTDNFNPTTGRFIDFAVTAAAGKAVGVYSSAGVLVGSSSTTSTTSDAVLTCGSELTRPGGYAPHSWPATPRGFAPGTYYVAVAGTSATFGDAWNVTTTSTDTTSVLEFKIKNNKDEVFTETAPATFTDLGTINNPSTDYDTADKAEAFSYVTGALWYKFVLSEDVSATNGKFLDVDTCDSLGFDTEIAIYDNNGTCIAMSDDDGYSLNSLVSFGDTTARNVSTLTGYSATGQNGGLTAGTYWIAVNRYSSDCRFGTKWHADGGSTTSASSFLNFRTNTGTGGGGGVSGVITLNDFVPGPNGRTVDISLYSGGLLADGPHTVTLDASGNYSFTTSAPDGTYDMMIDAGRTWLVKKVSITVTGGVGTADATVVNGDVNGEGIVDIADYTDLALAFDATPTSGNWNANADLNGDEIVDIADYTILALAFDKVDDVP